MYIRSQFKWLFAIDYKCAMKLLSYIIVKDDLSLKRHDFVKIVWKWERKKIFYDLFITQI